VKNKLEINSIEFELRPSSRRKKIAVGMEHSGTCFISYPMSLSQEKLKYVLGKDINKIIDDLKIKLSKINQYNYSEGEEFLFAGRYYSLKYTDTDNPPIELIGEHFYLSKNSLHNAYKVFENWYKKALYKRLEKILPLWTKKMGVNPQKISIKSVKTIWGSCSTKNNITFSTRLALVSDDLLEYVIVHELCHLKKMNHSNEFWNTLEFFLPDYKILKERLKANSLLYRW